jgi:hypothetical protein
MKISLIQTGVFVMVKVFLLGRPGSGKTTAFRYIDMVAHDKRRPTTRFREYTILHAMFLAGRGGFQKVEHNGFDITDFSVLNESAWLLEEQVQIYIHSHTRNDEFIFIELARDNYEQAMQCFSPSFLQDSYFLFIEANLETCIQRICHRVAHPTGTDGHFISEHILRSYYARNNIEYMTSHFKTDYHIQREVMVIENNGFFNDFIEKLGPFVDVVLSEIAITSPS